MSSAPRRALPSRPDPEQQRTLAKDLLRAFRRNDPEAVERVRAVLPDKSPVTLGDAQYVLAREYGFDTWPRLMEHIAAASADSLPPVEQLKRALHSRSVSRVRRVLEAHRSARESLNQPIFGFDAPVLVAANKDAGLVQVLLEFGADPNRKSDWWAGGFHPLYGATPEVAELLLAAGAVPDACALAHLDRVDELAVMLAGDPSRVHERGGDGQTPLHFARSRGVADLLLSHGADLDAIDVDHRATPAEWMVDGRADLATYLVERGARADIFLVAALGLTERAVAMLQARPNLLALRTSQGDYAERHPSSYHIYQWTLGPNLSPLQVAAKRGQLETMRAMEAFATPVQRLLLACHRGDETAARAIVAAHPGIVEGLAPDDARALTDEAWAPNPPAVRLMMALGFDPSMPSGSGPRGGTALHCAAWEGSVEAVAAIVEHDRGRALVNAVEPNWNGTPLSWCCHGSTNCSNPRADYGGVVRRLVAAGATVRPEMLEWEGSRAFEEAIAEVLRS